MLHVYKLLSSKLPMIRPNGNTHKLNPQPTFNIELICLLHDLPYLML